ncbi:hypothetical protein QE433_003852 [Agrobacterium tumefaciens]|nr:hypothetical protein [Agrobacterium tumefaciens]
MVMKPPIGGPVRGPTSAGIVKSAMAETSSLRCVVRRRTRRPTGVIIAPPIPCRKRETTNSNTDDETAQQIEPTTKTPMAKRKIFFAPYLSAIQPLMGMKIASDTI